MCEGGQIHILGWYFNQNFGYGRRITGFTYSMRTHAYYLILKCKFWRGENDLSQLLSSVVAKTQNLLKWRSGFGERIWNWSDYVERKGVVGENITFT